MASEYNRHIFGYECDIYGHLNNANYLRILEEARSIALNKIGFSLGYLLQQNIAIFVTDIHIKYLKQISFAEDVVIKSFVKKQNRLKCLWYQEIYDSKNTLCATAEISGAFAKNGNAARIDKEMYEKMIAQMKANELMNNEG